MKTASTLVFLSMSLCNSVPAQPPNAADQYAIFRRYSAQQIVEKFFREPPYDLTAIHRLVELEDPSAIPALKTAFDQDHRDVTRLYLAAALVSLREPDPRFFAYLLEVATEAVNNDMPFPMPGSKEDAVFREHFEKWKRSKSPEQLKAAMSKRLSSDMGAVLALAEANDVRSKPILYKGLLSPNFLVVQRSALGLARLQDENSIRLIIAACERLSPEAASLVAKAFAYFRSAEAQAALVRFIQNASERVAIVERARSSGPKGAVFEY